MLKIDRQQFIERELHLNGSILISDISKKLNCSEETIRRDLKEMEQRKLLTRIHGGAYLEEGYEKSVPIQLRETFLPEEKQRLADFILNSYIHENDILMLDSSTTCLTLAQQLLHSGLNLTIITNSLRICNLYDTNSSNVKLVCTGGTLRQRTSSFVGFTTTQAISQHIADKCFISCPAIDLQYGLLDNSMRESSIRKSYIQQSRKHFFIGDHTKFSEKADIVIAELNALNNIITNQKLSKAWNDKCSALDITIDYC